MTNVVDQVLQDEGSEASAYADGGDQHPEAARPDLEVILGEHDEQRRRRTRRQRGETLGSGQDGHKSVGANDAQTPAVCRPTHTPAATARTTRTPRCGPHAANTVIHLDVGPANR